MYAWFTILVSFAMTAAFANAATFNIAVSTQNVDKAGTNEDITLFVVDESNNSARIVLTDPNGDRFERGRTDVLSHTNNMPFGTPKRLSICLSNKNTYNGEWAVQDIVVNNQRFPLSMMITPGTCTSMINAA